jgi:short-subunit dehydrogenase
MGHRGEQRTAKSVGQRALITGASSGIGEQFARALAADGLDLVIVARRTTRLEALAQDLQAKHGVDVQVITADLFEEDTARAIRQECDDRGIVVDVLINNAGILLNGHFLQFDWREQRNLIQVMAVTPTALIHEFLPGMIERGHGMVLWVASLVAVLPASPMNTVYGPCKNYASVLINNLRTEYQRSEVTFSVYCPGVTGGTQMFDSERGAAWARVPGLVGNKETTVREAWRTAARRSGPT